MNLDEIRITQAVEMPPYHASPNKDFAAKLRPGDSFDFDGDYKSIANKGRNIRVHMRDLGLRLLSRKISNTKIRYWVVPLTKETEYED